MKTAWVLPGGASMGAVQAGQAQALMAAGLAPDMIFGTSAGSLNAAWLAADPTPRGADSLGGLWMGVRRRDVFPIAPVTAFMGALGRRDHVVPAGALTRWLEGKLPYRRLEEARIPLTVTVTDLDTGAPEYLSHGPAIPSLVASCAIPGVFAPVTLGGRTYVDGGMSAEAPVQRAVEAGADRVYVLPTLGVSATARPRGARDVLLRSLFLLLGTVRGASLSAAASSLELYVLPAPDPAGASPFSFRHCAEMMAEARGLTEAWLPSARPLGSIATV